MFLKIKEKYQKDKIKINNIITVLSIIVLVYYLFEMLFVGTNVLLWTFNVDKFFEIEMLKENGKIFSIHSKILTSAVMLLYLSIFCKHIKIYMVAGILLFNDIVPVYYFIEFIAPKYLDMLGVYNWRKQEGQVFINPQWTNVYLLVIGLTILITQVLLKKHRSIDRVFSLIIASSVTITLIVFHSVIVFGYYKFEREQQVDLLVRQINNENKDNYCKERLCFKVLYSNNGDILKVFDENNKVEIDRYLKKYSFFNHFIVSSYNSDKTNGYHFQNPETVGFDYFTVAIKKQTKDVASVVINDKNRRFSEINIIWFSFLSSIAHTIWICLGYGLLFLHKDYFFKKRKKL